MVSLRARSSSCPCRRGDREGVLRFLRLVAVLCTVVTMGSAAAATDPSRQPVASVIAAMDATPAAALELVHQHTAYRPYKGLLKGPRGTWWNASGNSLDRAELLRHVLQVKGIPSRLAYGRLAPQVARRLLNGLFAGVPPSRVEEFLPTDEARRLPHSGPQVPPRYFWVQARIGKTWIDLDPALEEPGKTLVQAPALRTLTQLPKGQQRRLRIEVYGKGNNGIKRRLLHLEWPTASLVGERLVLYFTGSGIESGTPSAVDALRPVLTIGDRVVAGRSLGGQGRHGPLLPAGRLGDVFGAFSPPASSPDRGRVEIWVDLRLTGAGLPERRQRRYLYLAGPDGLDRLSELTVFNVVFGSPPPWLRERSGKRLRELLAQVSPPGRGDAAPDPGRQAQALLDLAAEACHGLGLWLAAVTDQNLRNLDREFGTLSTYTDARVLAVSFAPEPLGLSTDLIFDPATSWIPPGANPAAPLVLGWFRGLLDAELEGQLLAAASGEDGARAPLLTTASIFAAARNAGIQLKALGPRQTKDIAALDLPAYARRVLGEHLRAGNAVVIPARPVSLAGRLRVAWYEIDGRTGQWHGVFADGRRQAIYEYMTTKDFAASGAGWAASTVSSAVGTWGSFFATGLGHFDKEKGITCEVFHEAYQNASSWDIVAMISIVANSMVAWATNFNPVVIVQFAAVEVALVLGIQKAVLLHLDSRYGKGCGDDGKEQGRHDDYTPQAVWNNR